MTCFLGFVFLSSTMCPRGLRLRLYRKLLQCSCSRWRCWINWRTWLTVAVVIIYCIILLIILPLMIYGLYELNAGVTFSAWFIAGIFVLMSIPIFLANLLQVCRTISLCFCHSFVTLFWHSQSLPLHFRKEGWLLKTNHLCCV